MPEPAGHSVDGTRRPPRPLEYLVVLGLLLAVTCIRLRLADIPLGRDEGEYAYAGQLLLHGVPPYVQAYNMKFPGTYYAYAAIMAVLGQDPRAIRIGLLVLNLATALVLFALGRRMTDRFTAGVSAAAFLVLSVDRWVQGTFAHATHFALLPALGGILMLFRAGDGRRALRLTAAGILLSTAVLMKQQAAMFFLFALWFVWHERSATRSVARDAGWVGFGGLVPAAAICLMFVLQGIFGRFVFWTFDYASEYVRLVSLPDGLTALGAGLRDITRATLPFWLLAAAGAAALWLTPWARFTRRSVSVFGVASFLSVCPGLYFRTHYFILLLPAAALCIGVAVTSIGRLAERAVARPLATAGAVSVLLVLTGAYVAKEWRYLFVLDANTLSREIYGHNPFVEAADIARYIHDRTLPSDRIAVLGSEPEIYFLADRPSATGYIYTYPLMEPQRYAARMQDEMIAEIETAHPKYLVAVLINASWLGRPSSSNRILEWAERYSTECYDLVGVVDIQSDATTVRWDAEALAYQPRSPYQVHTFRRKSTGSCAVAR
jgi:hypothetical protein